jgi:hypothetical protein
LGVADHNFTDDLSNRALDTIDSVVAAVNDKAIRPAIVAARAVVFGVIIGVIALVVAVLLSVGGLFAYSKRGVAPHSDD